VPELPEVETVARSIARIVGRRILSAEFHCARILRGDADQMSAALAGRRIRGIHRRGKFIVIELDAGQCLTVHLGMTGKLLLGGVPGRHTHAVFNLDRGVLRYEDQRQFGKLEVSRGLPARVERLGPEPIACPGRGAACNAAPQNRDRDTESVSGPRISSAPLRAAQHPGNDL